MRKIACSYDCSLPPYLSRQDALVSVCRAYLMAVAIFCNEVKGKSMLAFSRDLGTQYKTAFVLAHKIREAMASEMRGQQIGGEGRKAEIDGAKARFRDRCLCEHFETRPLPITTEIDRITSAALKHPTSAVWRGHWQRNAA